MHIKIVSLLALCIVCNTYPTRTEHTEAAAKTLIDENEEPSIRVALRNIKDFAIPFKSQDKIMWKYAFTNEEEPKKIEPIFKTPQTIPIGATPPSTKQTIGKKTFLKKIEEFLEKQNTEIISIEEVDKKKVIAKTKSESGTAILFAFSKKRITENELIKCYKQAKAANLPYHIITSGEPTKKMNETIDAYKKLIKFDKLNT